MLSILLSFLILENNTLALVVPLNQNELAPFQGLLFDKTSADKMYTELNDYDKVKLLNKSLEVSIDLYQKNEEVYKQEVQELTVQNTSLSEAVIKAKDNTTWDRILYFGLGVLTTSLIVYATKK